MIGSFKSRSQKSGLIVLLIACVFMMAWIRSRLQYDLLMLPWGDDTYCLESAWGALDVGIVSQSDNRTRLRWQSNALDATNWQARDANGLPTLEDHLTEIDVTDWRWDWGDFHFGAGHNQQHRSIDYTFPYWAIAVPLTALAMYLLLSKPRLTQRGLPEETTKTGAH